MCMKCTAALLVDMICTAVLLILAGGRYTTSVYKAFEAIPTSRPDVTTPPVPKPPGTIQVACLCLTTSVC